MADTVTLDYSLRSTVTEILDTTDVPAGSTNQGRTLKADEFNVSGQLTSTTTPPVDFATMKKVTLTGGTVTIDLTAAEKSAGRTQDLTGEKNVSLIIECPTTNSGAATIAPGSANPYVLFGAGQSISLDPGEVLEKQMVKGKAASKAAVSATVKNLDFTGTSGDFVHIQMTFG